MSAARKHIVVRLSLCSLIELTGCGQRQTAQTALARADSVRRATHSRDSAAVISAVAHPESLASAAELIRADAAVHRLDGLFDGRKGEHVLGLDHLELHRRAAIARVDTAERLAALQNDGYEATLHLDAVTQFRLFPYDSALLARVSAVRARIAPRVAARQQKERAELLRTGMAARKIFAQQFDAHLLDEWVDVNVAATGEFNENLELTHVTFNRVAPHKLQRDTQFLRAIRKAGFVSIVIKNGLGDSWIVIP